MELHLTSNVYATTEDLWAGWLMSQVCPCLWVFPTPVRLISLLMVTWSLLHLWTEDLTQLGNVRLCLRLPVIRVLPLLPYSTDPQKRMCLLGWVGWAHLGVGPSFSDGWNWDRMLSSRIVLHLEDMPSPGSWRYGHVLTLSTSGSRRREPPTYCSL